ncbi:MAG: hypothetical protein IJW27_04745, partial [Clostridia bacterium]|nr:hypothetical protein [Clostridia bacterium]
MRILLSDFEVYELTEQVISHDEYNYLDELDAVLGKNVYDHSFSELTDVPADWTVASGSAAMGTAEQGGVTKAGYSISGANGSMNSVRIKVPAENYVVKLSMYQVTGYWGGDNGRVYVGKQGRTDGDEAYYDIAQMQIGGYKRTSFLPPANGAAIYRYDCDGNPVQSTVTRLTDIGGGFGADGNSELTLFIYYYDGINYFVNEAGTLLGSSYDALVTEEQYITLAGDYMRILLSDFEIYELGDAINILDEINKAIDAEDADAFKALIKHKKSGIAYELITVDTEFMSALKSLKTAKGANLTAADIYQLSIVEVTDIGSRLELFVDDTLIDKNSTTAELVVMSPKYEGQILDLSGYFRCDDINNGVYTGSFDDSVINEDTRPWESLGSNEGGIVEVDGKYYYYYLGVDDGVVNADSYTGEGETDPVTYYFNVCVAVSEDGKTWTRPELGIYDFNYKGENLPNNIIISDIKENFGGGHIASFSAFKDTNPNADPDKPYKALMVVTKEKNWWGFNIYGLESSDGIHWEQINGGAPIMETASTECLDSQNIVFYSEKDQEYKFYFRLWQENEYFGRQRSIAVVTAKDFTNWNNIDEATIIDFYSDKTGEELLEDNLGLDGVHPDEYQL